MKKKNYREAHPEWFDGKGRPHVWVLRALIDYDPETGRMTWKQRGSEWFDGNHVGGGAWVSAENHAKGWNKKNAGKNVGVFDGKGMATRVLNVGLPNNHIAHAICHGQYHAGQLYYRDGDPRNLSLGNITGDPISMSHARRDAEFFKGGALKYHGVRKVANSWRASITVMYKKLELGTFKTEEEAADAYDRAALEYLGPTAYTNDAIHPEPEPTPEPEPAPVIDPAPTKSDDF